MCYPLYCFEDFSCPPGDPAVHPALPLVAALRGCLRAENARLNPAGFPGCGHRGTEPFSWTGIRSPPRPERGRVGARAAGWGGGRVILVRSRGEGADQLPPRPASGVPRGPGVGFSRPGAWASVQPSFEERKASGAGTQ